MSIRLLPRRSVFIIVGFALFAVVGCTEATATPTSQSEVPTLAASAASPTATALPAATASPTPMPVPSATPTPRPTATPLPPTPTPTPDLPHFVNGEPTQALLDELELWEEVTSSLRGVSPDSTERGRTFLTRDEFIDQSDQQQSEFEAGQTPEEKATNDQILEASNRLLRALGLIAVEADLIEESNLVLDDAVGGFFHPESGELNIIVDEREDSFGANDIRIYVHEYMHLLQDVGFDTLDFEAEPGEDDAARAVLSFTEGEAEFFAQLVIWHVRGREYLESAFEEEPVDGTSGSGDDPAAGDASESSFYLEQSFAFPYSAGIDFFAKMIVPQTPFPQTLTEFPPDPDQMAANFAAWSERLNEIHERLPASTEQVLHAEKYRTNELPLDVEIASAEVLLESGWTELWRSNWGEGGLRTWLQTARNASIRAGESDSRGEAGLQTAAAGWGGDQQVAIRSSCGEFASATLIKWDEPTLDAGEFGTEFDFWYGRNEGFADAPSQSERVSVRSGPSGFVAINQGADEEETVVVTADSAETAELLVLWLLGEGELVDNCSVP